MIVALLWRTFAALALIIWATGTAAQSLPVDYEKWENVATLAEGALEADEADDKALLELRGAIAAWRLQFVAQQTDNDSRLKTLAGQIKALGPLPEEGGTEPAEIVERRAELASQVARLTTPRLTADEAYIRAKGIIWEIDEILRVRQAEKLLDKGPWPINPTLWVPAFRELEGTLRVALSETVQAAKSPLGQEGAQNNLPLILILLVVGVVLLARSRRWSEMLVARIQGDGSGVSAAVAGFVVSLGQIILPMLGLLALVRAIGSTGLFGERGNVILYTLELMGFMMFFARWLASRMFPKTDGIYSPLLTTSERRVEGHVYSLVLAAVLAFYILLTRLAEADHYSVATKAVLNFPLIVLAGMLLLRFGWLLRSDNKVEDVSETPDLVFTDRLVGIISGLVIAVGILGPILAALGYSTASRWLVYPTILSLALIGTLSVIQRLVGDIYAMIRPGDGAAESLIPTLLKFALTFCSLPILALIWGARLTDLTEFWARLGSGLTVGGVTISPSSFLILIAVFFAGFLLTRGVQSALRNAVLPKTGIDPGGQIAIVSGIGYVGIFLAGLFSVTAAGIDLSNLALVAGALSVGIGFGLQTIVSNFVSGIILLIERPISEGDWIEVGGQMGYVRAISVRSTRIETFDRMDVIVPNADLISGTVTNYTRGNTIGRLIVPVGVAYGTDTQRVEKILQEIADTHPMALANPAPFINFVGFGADSLDFEIRVILRDVNWSLRVKTDMNHQINARFIEEGIEIPFAQRDLWLRNPEALKGEVPA